MDVDLNDFTRKMIADEKEKQRKRKLEAAQQQAKQ